MFYPSYFESKIFIHLGTTSYYKQYGIRIIYRYNLHWTKILTEWESEIFLTIENI